MKTAVILNDTSFESHHGCELVIKNIKDLLLKNGIKTIATNSVGEDWRKNYSFMKNIIQSDVVVVNGEGTIHHSYPRALELCSISRYVKDNYDTPVVLINSTIQENNEEIMEYLKLFDLVFVREGASFKELENYGLFSKIVPDMSFYTEYDLSNKNETSGIGFTDSVYLHVSKELFDLSTAKKHKFLPALTNIKIRINDYSSIISSLRYNVLKFCRGIYRLMGGGLRYEYERQFYYLNKYSGYINAISSVDFLIVARFHSLCFALKTMTPFYAIKSNSHKIDAMLDDIGIGRKRIKSVNDIKASKDKNEMQFDAKEKSLILNYVKDAPKRIENMFVEIKTLID